MQKVLLITEYFQPNPGALESFFSNLAESWQSKNIEVIVIYKNHKQQQPSKKEKRYYNNHKHFKIYWLDSEKGMFSFYHFQKRIKNLFVSRLHYFQPNYVLFSNFSFIHYLLSQELSKYQLPYGIFLDAENLCNHLGFYNLLNHRVIRYSSSIFTMSWYIARNAVKLGIPAEKICVLPPGFKPRWTKKNSFRLSFQYEEILLANQVLLSVGPLVPRKGIDIGIEVFKQLLQHHSNLHYIIVGSGPELVFLQEKVKSYKLEKFVHFTGFVSDDFLRILFENSDILLQPGKEREEDTEALGTIFMESAWFGLPTVTGDLGGAEEVVFDGVNGILCEIGNVANIASAVHKLLISDKLHQKFSQNAIKVAKKKFDFQYVFEKIQSQIHKVAKPSYF